MVDIGSWAGTGGYGSTSAAVRAARAWFLIQNDPSEITINRAGSELAAQTVRIEARSLQNRDSTTQGGGAVDVAPVAIFGVRDHGTVADTDIQRGDRFLYGGAPYEVKSVNTYPGQVQAIAERIT